MQAATALSPVAVWLRIVDDAGDLPVVQLLLDPLCSRLPLALVRRQGLHCGGRDRLLGVSLLFAVTNRLGDPRPFVNRRPVRWLAQSNMCLNSDMIGIESAIEIRAKMLFR